MRYSIANFTSFSRVLVIIYYKLNTELSYKGIEVYFNFY